MPDKRVFTAKLDDKPIIVKFSIRYSEAAHHAAAKHQLAPLLLGVERVYDWFQIVMNDVSSEFQTLAYLKEEARENDPSLNSLVWVQDKLIEGLQWLHVQKFVHGDVRDVNVMVDVKGRRVLLVDWDWAGVDGEARFPFTINQELYGYFGGELITRQYDLNMASRILD